MINPFFINALTGRSRDLAHSDKRCQRVFYSLHSDKPFKGLLFYSFFASVCDYYCHPSNYDPYVCFFTLITGLSSMFYFEPETSDGSGFFIWF